jgi:NAD(P)-dependent dehydrogenase (short-subunit alcohol dehydrogenase family)
MKVNLFGSWRMIQAFLPPLKRSAHTRIVNVSSGAGSYRSGLRPRIPRRRGSEVWNQQSCSECSDEHARRRIGRSTGHCERRLLWADATYPGAAAMESAQWRKARLGSCGRWVLPRWKASGP